MGFIQLGQEWLSYTPQGVPRSKAAHLRIGEWAWLEKHYNESGLCPRGEVVTVDEAIRLEDEQGNEIPGALERATLWEVIADRRGIQYPKSPTHRTVKRRKRTRPRGDIDGMG